MVIAGQNEQGKRPKLIVAERVLQKGGRAGDLGLPGNQHSSSWGMVSGVERFDEELSEGAEEERGRE